MALKNLYNRIKALEQFDVQLESIRIINEYHWYLEAMIRLQLQEGKDFEGQPVTIFGRDYYKDATIFDKQRHGVGLGKETEFITNYNSGHFYSSLKTSAKGTIFETDSNVPYFSDILQRSGDRIIKVSKKHLIQFQKEILIPQLKIAFKRLNGV